MAFDKKAYNHKWHIENRKKNAERHRKWRAKNPDKDAVYNKRWRERNSERMSALTWEWRLNRDFGLSVIEYKYILAKQNFVCAICGQPDANRRLSVDHCHATGKVRGLLCLRCNRGIGLFQDDPNRLVKASVYLKETL